LPGQSLDHGSQSSSYRDGEISVSEVGLDFDLDEM
jgi:hypothetical protein